jgi:hypothetical protein
MSGIFTVPFTIVAVAVPSGYARGIFGTMAVAAVLFTAYRIWREERRQLVENKQHLAPRLRIEFDPYQPKFVSPTTTVDNYKTLYVRVLACAVSPTVRGCRVYLQRISQVDGEKYVTLFDESLQLPWSYEDPNILEPRTLNHHVDKFADVAWFAEPGDRLSFGFLNAASILPTRLHDIVKNKVLPNPSQNLKLDLLIIGEDSEHATLSLNIHRGQAAWDKPQIGWMDNTGAIRRESTEQRG